MNRVSIVGATGYTGGELLRILLRHPGIRVTHATSETFAGKNLSSVHPDLLGRCGLVAEKLNVRAVARDTDAAFLCLPHGRSADTAKRFLDLGVRVIDLSADFRLKSLPGYRKWYGSAHPHPRLVPEAVYGLPEIHRRKIAGARLVANPGCYATASILALLPLAKSGRIKPGSVVIDAKSGVSGAGRKVEARYLFCETNENFLAYAVGRHRHAPEIEQELGAQVTFVPHLLPVNRGILVTAYADLKSPDSNAGLSELYRDFYRGEAFVKVLSPGAFPELRAVQNSNFCHIGVATAARGRRAVVVGVIDNLGKGASGQAVQNMNILLGMDEKSGLA